MPAGGRQGGDAERHSDTRCKRIWRKYDPRGKGNVAQSKLALLLRDCGLPADRIALNEFITAYPGAEHECVAFVDFRHYYRAKKMRSKAHSTNSILLKTDVGRVRGATR